MHEISQELAIATKPGTWDPSGGWKEADLIELRRDAVIAMLNTPVGEKLLERGGEQMEQRILDAFAERYEGKFPSSAPFFETLMQVAHDLLLAETQEPVPPKPAPKPKAAPVLTVQQKEKLRLDKEERQKHEGKVRQFAYLVKKQLNTKGVESLKPRSGLVTVVAETGQSYEYPSATFENLWAEAAKLGLLTIGGLR